MICIFKKIQNKLLTAAMLVCLMVFAACWFLSVRWYLLTAAAAAAMLCLFRALLHRNEHRLKNIHCTLIFAGCCLLLLAAQIYYVSNITYVPAMSDPVLYGDLAKQFVRTGSFEGLRKSCYIYASRYPNTWGSTFLLIGWYSVWYRLTGDITVTAGHTLDIIAVQTALVFTYLTARNVFRSRTDALICGVSAAFCPLYLLYTPIFHSDILSVAFTAPVMYLLTKAMKKNGSGRYARIAGAAVLTGLGNTLKGTLVILAIAASVIFLLRFKPKLSLPAAAMLIGGVVLASAGMMQLGLATGISSREAMDEYRYPTVHWIMMGTNKKGGGYYRPDSIYTRNAGSYEEKKQADTERLHRRFQHMQGPAGVMKMVKFKIYRIWNCSDRRYQRFMRSTYTADGIANMLIHSEYPRAFCHLDHNCRMFCIFAAMIYACRRRAAPAVRFGGMALAGLMLFLVLWEANPRYNICFMPLMQLLTAAGVRYICNVAKIHWDKIGGAARHSLCAAE
ncbi:MAG: glycosyltransferase family 39 protein [Ruminococcus sp.]|nr:glycosyltransferase family 39 protein [Ruminococcus sp.]